MLIGEALLHHYVITSCSTFFLKAFLPKSSLRVSLTDKRVHEDASGFPSNAVAVNQKNGIFESSAICCSDLQCKAEAGVLRSGEHV